MSRRTVASCLLAGCQLALFLLLPIAGRAEWDPTHPDPIIEYHYSYDGVGNITAIHDAVKNSTSTFTYDEVDRLTQAIGPYGANGAQQTKTYSYNEVGDFTDTPPLNTDGNGNITQLNGKAIEYDYENRPIKITETATGVITEFGYDYSGQRIFKTVTSGTQWSETLYCGNIYEETYSSSTVVQTAHIYAGSLRVASRVTQNGMSRTYYYLGDHLGSTRMMTDALGNVVQDITYEPWGSTVTESSTTYKADYKYTGQALDDSTGLYYYGARYYDPSLKRFITPDTIVEAPYDPQSLNRYVYVRNNPLIYTDPTGHWRLDNFGVSVLQAVPYAMMFAGVPPPVSIAISMGSSMAQAGLQGGNFSEAMIAGGISGVTTGLGMGIAQGMMPAGIGEGLSRTMAAGATAGFVSGGAGALLSGQSGAAAWRAAFQGGAIGASMSGIMWGMQQNNPDVAMYREAVIAYRLAQSAAKSLNLSEYSKYAFAGDARMFPVMDGGKVPEKTWSNFYYRRINKLGLVFGLGEMSGGMLSIGWGVAQVGATQGAAGISGSLAIKSGLVTFSVGIVDFMASFVGEGPSILGLYPLGFPIYYSPENGQQLPPPNTKR